MVFLKEDKEVDFIKEKGWLTVLELNGKKEKEVVFKKGILVKDLDIKVDYKEVPKEANSEVLKEKVIEIFWIGNR